MGGEQRAKIAVKDHASSMISSPGRGRVAQQLAQDVEGGAHAPVRAVENRMADIDHQMTMAEDHSGIDG